MHANIQKRGHGDGPGSMRNDLEEGEVEPAGVKKPAAALVGQRLSRALSSTQGGIREGADKSGGCGSGRGGTASAGSRLIGTVKSFSSEKGYGCAH